MGGVSELPGLLVWKGGHWPSCKFMAYGSLKVWLLRFAQLNLELNWHLEKKYSPETMVHANIKMLKLNTAS